MNFKLTITLGGVLAVLLAAVFLTGRGEPAPSPINAAAGDGAELISAAAADISDIKVKSGGQTVTVHRQSGDDWVYSVGAAGLTDPADNARIRSLVTRLAGLRAQSTVAQQPDAAALKEYGLDTPSSQVTVRANDAERNLFVGIENPRGTGRYVQTESGGPVYLVQAFLLDDLKSLTTTPPVQPTPAPTVAPTATPEAAPSAAATPGPAASASPTAAP